jgi:hypothetical protein
MGRVNEEICVGGFCCEVASRHPGRSSPSAGSWGIQGSLRKGKAEEEGGERKKGGHLPTKCDSGHALAASRTQTPFPQPKSRTLRGGDSNSCQVRLLERLWKNKWVDMSLWE